MQRNHSRPLLSPGAPTVIMQVPAFGPGAVIGGYRVLEPLSWSGTGMVFAGEHLQLGRRVALKFLHQDLLGDPAAVARFFAEATAAARISHPGVVAIFDYGSFDRGIYLVMEHLAGESLQSRLERVQRLSIAHTIDLGTQLALTLAAAHEAGVVHRDLKPDNIHLVPDPAGTSYEFAKVLDFGVAKLTAVAAPITRRGDLLGTPYYMAPEQSIDPSSVDHTTDIYSLGCVLFQLATGFLPFRGSVMQVLQAHQAEAPPLPRHVDPNIPPYLESLILRMMAKAPRARPSSMVEVVGALSTIQSTWR
jgi:eukaryotic-like serine/threonine-protein kinase